MPRFPLVVLGRRPALLREVASWHLPEVELVAFESPSEALARLTDGRGALLLFDTVGYARSRHVVRKFLSLPGDADLVVLGEADLLADADPSRPAGEVVRLEADAPPAELRAVVERQLRLRAVRLRSGIVGRSRAIGGVIALVAQAAPLDVNILILGESGTGKELVARAIHAHSPRRAGPYVSLNCGAMSEGVLESELFGHARGAFTGAVSRHDGVFKRADGGTLFLDEVAEMPLGMQTRFLRALETGEFTPVGGSETLRSNIRLVAATHQDLARAAETGRFRQDLYYRLHVVVILIPPLRERREDIPVLAETFLAQENARHGLAVRGIARPAMQLLEAHAWPGNVRELRNVISSIVVLKQAGMIEADDLPPDVRGGAAPDPRRLPVPITADRSDLERELIMQTLLELRRDLHEIKTLLRDGRSGGPTAGPITGGGVIDTFAGETGFSPLAPPGGGDLATLSRRLIESALRAAGGRRRLAAERLGISERTLYRKIRKFGL